MASARAVADAEHRCPLKHSWCCSSAAPTRAACCAGPTALGGKQHTTSRGLASPIRSSNPQPSAHTQRREGAACVAGPLAPPRGARRTTPSRRCAAAALSSAPTSSQAREAWSPARPRSRAPQASARFWGRRRAAAPPPSATRRCSRQQQEDLLSTRRHRRRQTAASRGGRHARRCAPMVQPQTRRRQALLPAATLRPQLSQATAPPSGSERPGSPGLPGDRRAQTPQQPAATAATPLQRPPRRRHCSRSSSGSAGSGSRRRSPTARRQMARRQVRKAPLSLFSCLC